VSKTNENADILEEIIDNAIYSITESVNSPIGNSDKALKLKKMITSSNVLVRMLGVGLKYKITLANWAGQQFLAYINSGGVYTGREYRANYRRIVTNTLSEKQRALLDLLVPLNEDVSEETRRKIGKKISYKNYLNTWTVNDVMMVSNSWPERGLQYSNAMSFNENTMVLNGRLVNIREHVRAIDRAAREDMSAQGRKEQRDTFKERVKALQESSAIVNTVVVGENGAHIPGVTDKAMAEYRVKVQDFSRKLNGQMSSDDKAAYRRNTLFTSFMMFRTWIPKLFSERIKSLSYDHSQENWEYGRYTIWFQAMKKVSFYNINRMRAIMTMSEEGMKIMDEMLAERRQKHLDDTGEVLKITKEEYYDLVNQELANMAKELQLLLSIAGALALAKSQEPPEDATLQERNAYKAMAKILNKVSDELLFFVSPTTFTSVTKGNLLPGLSLLGNVIKLFTQMTKAGYGAAFDEDMYESAHARKSFFNLIPVLNPLMNDVLIHTNPEYAKDLGVVTSAQARRN